MLERVFVANKTVANAFVGIIGIPACYVNSIFEKFFHTDNIACCRNTKKAIALFDQINLKYCLKNEGGVLPKLEILK